MPEITLQDIRDAADKKFGPLVVKDVPGGDVVLLNPARLSKEKRGALKSAVEQEDLDEQERLEQIVKATAKTPDHAKRLLKEFKDDLGGLAVVLESYNQGSQMGEASPSAS